MIALPALTQTFRENRTFLLSTPALELSGTGYACIIGTNGSGKSTMGAALAAVKGPAWLYLPQYLDRFLFGEHLEEQLTEILAQSLDLDRLNHELEALGFEDPQTMLRFPFVLMSGGERRRIALASIFYMHPEYLILDEPDIGLAPKENMVLVEKLNNLQAAMRGMLVISHHHGIVARSTDLICLRAGHVEQSGTTSELLNDPGFNLSNYGVRRLAE